MWKKSIPYCFRNGLADFGASVTDIRFLLFPHLCAGCGIDLPGKHAPLCLRCMVDLPLTNFYGYRDNPVEKHFWGRLPVSAATAFLHFNRGSLVQRLLHEIKYRGNRDIGIFLGKLMGEQLAASEAFKNCSLLVPVPLFASRLRKRGYNQSALLCEGMSEAMGIRFCNDALLRMAATDTQTKKNRQERWVNMQDRFQLNKTAEMEGHHILLVDDVVTTGATLEACGKALLSVNNCTMSIAALAYAV